jgi:BirA family transcriptional regulator, biotin operon repressor / biotin---[acetyl-CoA-carboxylase] ligase
VDSTNNYARRLIHEGLAQHGIAIFAYEQLAGKGQRGKVWATEKNANITMSIVFKPGLLLSEQFQLSACVAIAVHDFFTRYGGENTKIKWPNDLYWQDRKAGGILIENILQSLGSGPDIYRVGSRDPETSGWLWAIIGMGININQTHFHPDLPNPVSLKQITGKNFDPVVLAKELFVILSNYYQQLITDGFDGIYAQYLSHLYKKDEPVKLKKGSRVFEAVIKGVSPAGLLMARHDIEEEFNFGEVEWVI